MSATKKAARARFRNAVLDRDGHICRMCSAQEVPLDAHHITDRNELPNGGYVASNGITLCNVPGGCHEKAEEFHSTGLAAPGFAPDDLYAVIGSSRLQAFQDAERVSS